VRFLNEGNAQINDIIWFIRINSSNNWHTSGISLENIVVCQVLSETRTNVLFIISSGIELQSYKAHIHLDICNTEQHHRTKQHRGALKQARSGSGEAE
jgi:hypothetical protein